MPKYYQNFTQETELSQKSGSALIVSPEFRIISSNIIAQCIFMQNLIQQIIFVSHGNELNEAKKTLRNSPNPKARVDFLCSFSYTDDDPVVTRVFNFARTLFAEIYELRNILAHEVWSSSDSRPNSVLFSSLDENARLQMASGRLWHADDANAQDTYSATIRFIRAVKIISVENLVSASNDVDLCNMCFMNIINILSETDPERKQAARQPFFVYQGTSHLFPEYPPASSTAEFTSSKGKTINQ